MFQVLIFLVFVQLVYNINVSNVPVDDLNGKLLASPQKTLVLVTVPWCRESRDMHDLLENLDLEEILGFQINALEVSEVPETFREDFDIKKYPTIWMVEGDKWIAKYTSGANQSLVIEWISRLINPGVPMISSVAELPKWLLDERTVFLISKDFKENSQINRMIDTYKSRAYFFYSSELAGQATILESRRPYDSVDKTSDLETMDSFINQRLLPLFGTLHSGTYQHYISSGRPVVFCLVKHKYRYLTDLRKLAIDLPNFAFVYAEPALYKEAFSNFHGVENVPAIVVQTDPKLSARYVFYPSGSSDYYFQISNYLANLDKQTVHYRSESLSEITEIKEMPDVMPLTGEILIPSVYNQPYNTFLFVYAHWCRACTEIAQEVNTLVHLIDSTALKGLTRINCLEGSLNDSTLPSFQWVGFPIFLYIEGTTNKVSVYDGEYSSEAMLTFLMSKPKPIDTEHSEL